ncbi:MFS transporter [Rosenbergiella australiborealis]|uniref:MFS transporter n=2 Tax=Rosenbergiella australiborealis TaxID=1544696 RepID=A0ABS5T0V9_9GAMM|nr:MFS transporter [Rosenbergiella australiborealis]MBT0725979.1 MFS transporter [Rosenbergiella australiborealis]
MSHKAKILSARRWWYLMPIIFTTYSFAYLDRANFGFAVVAGIENDLGISKNTASLMSALFFLAYFIFQVPSSLYAVRRSVRKLLFICLVLWGLCATATGMVNNIPALLVIRFTLGIVEAAAMPAMLIYISTWFTQEERSRANTFLILGNPITVLWMSVLSGYLIQSYGWREMFIIEGIPALLWAAIWWWLVRDKPADVNWLSAKEKAELQQVMDNEQASIKPIANYVQGLRCTNVILLSFAYTLWSIGVYGLMMWLPSIIKSASSIDIVSVGWLSAPPYLAAVILMVIVSWLSDNLLNRKVFIWPILMIASLAFIASCLLADSHFWLSYGLLIIATACMYAPYGPFFALIPELLPRNVSGIAIGLINSFGALGAFLGAYFVGFLNGAMGSPNASYCFMASALLVAVICVYNVNTTKNTLKKPRYICNHDR